MGGGAAMRAAARGAKIGSGVNGRVSGAVTQGTLSSSVNAKQAAHRTSSSSSSASATEDAKVGLFPATPLPPNPETEQQQQPGEALAAASWEFVEWELGEDQFVEDKVSTSPRLVFGPVPTIEEAGEAVQDFRKALSNMYIFPTKSAGGEGPVPAGQEHSETKACVTDETSVVPSMPNQAYQAFKMITENAVAQQVVASIASDPNVWEAVLHNKALLEHCQQGKTCVESEQAMDMNSCKDSSFVDGTDPADAVPKGVFDKVKVAIMEMVNNCSNFMRDLFGGQDEKSTAEGTGAGSSMQVAGTFVGLATMVILVIVLKRS